MNNDNDLENNKDSNAKSMQQKLLSQEEQKNYKEL